MCREVTDAGAIYSGRSYIMRGNEVTNNYIHDFRTKDDKVQREDTIAIYLDDMMSGVKVSGNIIENGQIGIQINGGVDNIVSDNILLDLDRVFYTSNVGEGTNVDITPLVETAKAVLADYPVWNTTYPDIEKVTAEDVKLAGITFKKGFKGEPLDNIIRNNISDRTARIIDRFIELGTVENNTVVSKGLTELLNEKGISLDNIGLQTCVDTAEKEFFKYYPENNAVSVNPYNCTFKWQDAKSADKYKLIIAKDAALDSIVYEEICNSNYCEVKDFDAGCKKYYWQVLAINDAGNTEWTADDVYSFETSGNNWIYESDSKPSNTIDLSGFLNEKVFLAEGTENTANGLAGNKATLKNIYEKNRESLNIDGVVYKLADFDGSYDAINTNSGSVEISFNNENCEMISFLASGVDGEVYSYPVKIVYTDETSDTSYIKIGAFAERTDTYALKTGTITANGKAENAGGYIYQFNMPANSEKQVEKIVLGSGNVRIYAVTGVLPEVVETANGLKYNIMLNGTCDTIIKKIFTQVDENNKLIGTKTEDITTNGTMKEKLIKVDLPTVDVNAKEMNLYLWNDLSGMTPNSYKITKEITK